MERIPNSPNNAVRRKAVVEAEAAVRRLMAVEWDLLQRSPEVGLTFRHPEGALAPEGPAIAELSVSVEQLRQHAVEALQSREDTWRPHAPALAEWLPKAVKAAKAGRSLSLLKPADKWLKDAADAIRNERFAPIADQTKRIWDQLKLQSKVSLEAVLRHYPGDATDLAAAIETHLADWTSALDQLRQAAKTELLSREDTCVI